jgi:hypothetical protein
MTKHATKVVADCDKNGSCMRQSDANIHNITCYRKSGKTLKAFSPSTQAKANASKRE